MMGGLADDFLEQFIGINPSADEMAEKLDLEVGKLEKRIRKLEDLAYIGDHHFDDQTWKARCEEVVEVQRKLEQETERLKFAMLGRAFVMAALLQTSCYEESFDCPFCPCYKECDNTNAM